MFPSQKQMNAIEKRSLLKSIPNGETPKYGRLLSVALVVVNNQATGEVIDPFASTLGFPFTVRLAAGERLPSEEAVWSYDLSGA